ncbi:ribonuclease H-like [Macrobrachium nipponense]|uniref:ribonuclease H-like n=1 Tax=Macrobrachium nipponense TaxID=159736 RepID=UPI0030C8B921
MTLQYQLHSPPASKEACNIQQLKQAAQDSIRKTTATNEYFTDGSVDLSISATAAGVYSTSLKGSWRLSDNASTLQTELIAIAKELEDLQHKLGNTTIHTDSKGAIQAITKGKAKENIKLLTSIWAIANIHQTRNRQITLNWIPSHIGIQGNEEADSLAKSGLHINNIGIKNKPFTDST